MLPVAQGSLHSRSPSNVYFHPEKGPARFVKVVGGGFKLLPDRVFNQKDGPPAPVPGELRRANEFTTAGTHGRAQPGPKKETTPSPPARLPSSRCGRGFLGDGSTSRAELLRRQSTCFGPLKDGPVLNAEWRRNEWFSFKDLPCINV